MCERLRGTMDTALQRRAPALASGENRATAVKVLISVPASIKTNRRFRCDLCPVNGSSSGASRHPGSGPGQALLPAVRGDKRLWHESHAVHVPAGAQCGVLNRDGPIMDIEALLSAALREAGYGPDAIGSALPRLLRILEAEDVRIEMGRNLSRKEREYVRLQLELGLGVSEVVAGLKKK